MLGRSWGFNYKALHRDWAGIPSCRAHHQRFCGSLREALKKNIESLAAVKPTLDLPPPLSLTALGFFSRGVCFFIYRVVEKGMKQILLKFRLFLTIKTQTNSRTTFDKNGVR